MKLSSCGARAVQFLLAWVTVGCGPDTFVVIGPVGDGSSGDEASRQEDADASSQEDAKLDVKFADDAAADAVDASCDVGVQACVNVETFYCSRMKACCNGGCQFSWQNNGGSECLARFYNASCTGKMICEDACIADLQAASCATIKSNGSPGPIASSCMALY